MVEAVSDAGPFIHLAQVGQLSLLSMFSKILVPSKVISEVTIGNEPGIKKITSWPNLEKFTLSSKAINKFKKLIPDIKLEEGEMQALWLCLNAGVSLFLTDDLDARTIALKLGLEVHGSIGIIVRAYKRKMIDLKRAEQAINDLYFKSKLFVTQGITTNAINTLRKMRKNE